MTGVTNTENVAELPDDKALRMLDLIRGCGGESYRVVVDGNPVSKARARWSRKSRSFYTPSHTSGQEGVLAHHMRQALAGRTLTGNVAVVAIFHRSDYQRIDADNLMKLVMDAGTKAGIWKDDCQVTAQASFIELDKARPRTEVVLGPASSTLSRERTVRLVCEFCAGDYERSRFLGRDREHTKFCSQVCMGMAKRVTAACVRCGSEFRRRSGGQRFCSQKCAKQDPARRLPAGYQREPPLCTKCGTRVSRREYLFCSGCRQQGRKRGSKNKPKVVA